MINNSGGYVLLLARMNSSQEEKINCLSSGMLSKEKFS